MKISVLPKFYALYEYLSIPHRDPIPPVPMKYLIFNEEEVKFQCLLKEIVWSTTKVVTRGNQVLQTFNGYFDCQRSTGTVIGRSSCLKKFHCEYSHIEFVKFDAALCLFNITSI